MIKLKCHTSVVMNTGEVAFKAGEEYWFHMNASGEISRTTDKGVHMFRASGVDGWTNYFEYALEDGKC